MINNRSGMTLTELVVSSILIGIVMTGIAAFTVAIKQIQNVTDKSTVLAIETAATMSQISKDAATAIGWINDQGVVVDPATPPTYISFRHDVNSTPSDYSDDEWVIYYYDGLYLKTCSQDASLTTPSIPSNLNDCDPAINSDWTVLQKNIESVDFDLVNDPVALDFYASIQINAVYNSANSIDPIENPLYSLTAQVSPLSHSWN